MFHSCWSFILAIVTLSSTSTVNAAWESLRERNWTKSGNDRICKSKHLTPKQEHLCRQFMDHMPHVNIASAKAVEWCQNQFNDVKWNCSAQRQDERDDIFGRIAKIARTVNTLRQSLDSCGCQAKSPSSYPKPTNLGENTEWYQCGDDWKYAMGWAGQFADLALHEEEDEIESCLVNLSQNKPCESRKKSRSKQTETRLLSKLARVKVGRDNNLVGRQVAVKSRTQACKCHGPSGSCTKKTCWSELPSMEVISAKLKKLYDSAHQMKWRKKRNTTGGEVPTIEIYPFKIVNEKSRTDQRKRLQQSSKRNREDRSTPSKEAVLKFVQKSPDFCKKDIKRGIPGTGGRKCNMDSNGPDGCKKLCCGRGYYVDNITTIEDCNCRFEWCCKVECDKCERNIRQAYCK